MVLRVARPKIPGHVEAAGRLRRQPRGHLQLDVGRRWQTGRDGHGPSRPHVLEHWSGTAKMRISNFSTLSRRLLETTPETTRGPSPEALEPSPVAPCTQGALPLGSRS